MVGGGGDARGDGPLGPGRHRRPTRPSSAAPLFAQVVASMALTNRSSTRSRRQFSSKHLSIGQAELITSDRGRDVRCRRRSKPDGFGGESGHSTIGLGCWWHVQLRGDRVESEPAEGTLVALIRDRAVLHTICGVVVGAAQLRTRVAQRNTPKRQMAQVSRRMPTSSFSSRSAASVGSDISAGSTCPANPHPRVWNDAGGTPEQHKHLLIAYQEHRCHSPSPAQSHSRSVDGAAPSPGAKRPCRSGIWACRTPPARPAEWKETSGIVGPLFFTRGTGRAVVARAVRVVVLA